MKILVAPDKFRGTATATEMAQAIAGACRAAGHQTIVVPLSDGGEGFLEAFGGANRSSIVTGPLAVPVSAGWRLTKHTAILEVAQSSGLALVGGAEHNDPVAASTAGTGELIREAVESGARRVLIGHGGSASTDGGLAALRSLFPTARFRGIDLVAAVDVRTHFLDAADVFGPQKGATVSQVELLRRRLERLAQVYQDDYDIDVTVLPGAGAAGGLAGGLATMGASIVSGFELVAEELALDEQMEHVDLVVTGEGFIDEASFEGKVVGGVVELAAEIDVPVLAVAGEVFDGVHGRVEAISLVDRFGRDRALADPLGCATDAVAGWLDRS